MNVVCAAMTWLSSSTGLLSNSILRTSLTARHDCEIATPMTRNEDVDPQMIERPCVPVGRPGDAREVASLIAWLCSDHTGS